MNYISQLRKAGVSNDDIEEIEVLYDTYVADGNNPKSAGELALNTYLTGLHKDYGLVAERIKAKGGKAPEID